MGIIPEVKIEEDNDLLYLVIKIDEYPMPISYQGKFYLRSVSNNHEVTGSELDKFMLDRVGKRWEDLPVKNVGKMKYKNDPINDPINITETEIKIIELIQQNSQIDVISHMAGWSIISHCRL